MRYTPLLLLLFVVACTAPNRNAECLQQAERHSWAGQADSVLTYLYRIDENRLSVEDRHTFYRLTFSCTLADGPEALQQMHATAAYYEERGDTANLEVMRNALVQNYRYGRSYARADSLLQLMERDYTLRGDSNGLRWTCAMRARICEQQGMTDSALYYIDRRIGLERNRLQAKYQYAWKADVLLGAHDYDKAEAYLDSAKAIATDVGDEEYLYHLTERYRRLYAEQHRYDDLMSLLQESRRYMKRADVASHNLYKAQVHELMHRDDSARYYYRLVAESENLFLASEALYHLSQYYLAADDMERAYHYHQDATGYIDQVFGAYRSQAKRNAFSELKLQVEIDALKISRQRQVIVILSLGLLLVGLAASIVMLLQARKRRELEARQMQVEQENRLLRQAEELGRLHEKANQLREVLIRKMEIFQKLPSKNDELPESNRAIAISNKEWSEIRTLLDAEYEQFTSRLRKVAPTLTVVDINLCCLLKLNVSMQDLANIYCINKASVSRRKQRIKEKIGNELLLGLTLDDFLQRF